jgi:hypothetical protein
MAFSLERENFRCRDRQSQAQDYSRTQIRRLVITTETFDPSDRSGKNERQGARLPVLREKPAGERLAAHD